MKLMDGMERARGKRGRGRGGKVIMMICRKGGESGRSEIKKISSWQG